MDTAAGNGHLEVVQFLHEHRREGCSTRALNQAALNGFADVSQAVGAGNCVKHSTLLLDYT
jgi:hypothetical protein